MAPGQENATLKERCFQKDWCVKKMLEQMQNVRGEPVIMEAGATARVDLSYDILWETLI